MNKAERDKKIQSRATVSPMGASGYDPRGRREEIEFCSHCPKRMKKDSDEYVRVKVQDSGFFSFGLKNHGFVLCKNCYGLYLDAEEKKNSPNLKFPFSELSLKTEIGKIVVPEKKPEDQLQEPQRTAVRRGIKPRTSYVSPSREGKVTITAHVDPELKEAVTKLADQSNLTFNEFITAILKRAVASPAQQTDQTLHLSEEALEKTREAEKVLHRLTVTLSSHSR